MESSSGYAPDCAASLLPGVRYQHEYRHPRSFTTGVSLWGKHVRQNAQDRKRSGIADLSESPNQASVIDRADLIQNDLSVFSLEPNGDTGRIWTSFPRHRGYDNGSNVPVQLIGRDHHAWARLADFMSLGGIESHQIDIEAGCYHSHSVPSHSVAGKDPASTRVSSSFSRIRRKASSQSPRGGSVERTTKWSRQSSNPTTS